MMEELALLIQNINHLKEEIDALRPLNKVLEEKIMQKFRIDWNFHSNHIEGNKLDYGETKVFLLHGLTAKGKPLKDHLEMSGHNEAIIWLEEIVKSNGSISEHFIRSLHTLILKRTNEKSADKINVGDYKKEDNYVLTITNEKLYFISAIETPAAMHDLLEWYRQNIHQEPIVVASLFHYRFIKIHPFDDGNGRIARLLLNLVLMQAGFPPIIIKAEKKDDYYNALRMADGGQEMEFVKYIAERLLESMTLYLKGAKGESIEEPEDRSKAISLEIALLKKKFYEVTYSNIELNSENQDFILKKHILPFIDKFHSRFSEFEVLFEKNENEISYNNFSKSLKSYKELFDNLNITEKNVITIDIFFEDFMVIKPIDRPCIFVHCFIHFSKYSYTISTDYSEVSDKYEYLNGEKNDECFDQRKIYYHEENVDKIHTSIIDNLTEPLLESIKKYINQ